MTLDLITLDAIEDEAYIAACELVGPNAYNFDAVQERLIDEAIAKHNADLDDEFDWYDLCMERDALKHPEPPLPNDHHLRPVLHDAHVGAKWAEDTIPF